MAGWRSRPRRSRPGPSGRSQRAPGTAIHHGACTTAFVFSSRRAICRERCRRNTNDHPKRSASVTYPVASMNAANCAFVTACAPIANGLSVTSRTGPSPSGSGPPPFAPIRNAPPGSSTIAPAAGSAPGSMPRGASARPRASVAAESAREGAHEVALGVQQASPGSCATASSGASARAFPRRLRCRVESRHSALRVKEARDGGDAPGVSADAVCRRD